MRPDEYARLTETLISGASAGMGISLLPTKPAITATRLKGEPIMETRQVQVGTKPGNVLLELTPRAAETLLIIGRWIGGDPKTTRRGDMKDLTDALYGVGITLPLNYRESVDAYNDGLVFRPVA